MLKQERETHQVIEGIPENLPDQPESPAEWGPIDRPMPDSPPDETEPSAGQPEADANISDAPVSPEPPEAVEPLGEFPPPVATFNENTFDAAAPARPVEKKMIPLVIYALVGSALL
ncbi:MAG: hypothetical protein IPK19_24315 [Chloroflexi bacterium]|nr:hypothetical protein [Chloroflexota bacterium]